MHLSKESLAILVTVIDSPAHGLRWYQFNIPQYAAFIDILVQNSSPTISNGTFTRR
jgi:hypothetical protein